MTDFEILMGKSPKKAAPLEVQKYSEWSQTASPDLDQTQSRFDYSNYLREQYIKADQYSVDTEQEIRAGLSGSLLREGLVEEDDQDALDSLYKPTEQSFEEKVNLVQSSIGYEDPDWEAVTRYKSLAKVVGADPEAAQVTLDNLEEARAQAEQIVGSRFDDVKRSMVNNGELGFAVVTGEDGNPEFIAGDRATKSDLITALKDSKIGGVQLSDAFIAQDQLSIQQGTELPKYKYKRLREAHDMIMELAEQDEGLRYQISGHGTRLARSEHDKKDAWELFMNDAGQDISDAAGWLIGKVTGGQQDERTAAAKEKRAAIAHAGSAYFDDATKELARRLNNVEGISESDAFSLEEVQTAYKQAILNDANANNKFEFHDDDDEVGKNIRTYGYLGPAVHPAAMANKDVFDRMLAARPDVDDSVKETLTRSRTAFLESNFSDMSDLLGRSAQSDEWGNALTKGRATGQANHEILSDFLADEENFSEFAERTKGVAWSLWDSVTQLAAAVPAAFGANWAQDTLVNSARRNSDRREVAKLFGEDFGFFQDIGETIAPLLVDVAATAVLSVATAPIAGAGGAAYLAARQGARFTAKGLGKALTSSVFRTTGKESAKEAAQTLLTKGLIKQSVKDAGTEGAAAAIKGYNSLVANRLGIAAASFVPAGTRSGAATYGTLFNELQKSTDLSREEIHDRALGGALMAGAFTGFITAGFGALGRGGVEDALLKGMSFKRLSSVLKSVANTKGIGDQTVARAMSKQLTSQLKKYKFSGARSLLGNAVDEAYEEGLDEFINGFVSDAVLEENTPMLERMSQSLYAGALGGVMGAGVPAIQRLNAKIRPNRFGQAAATARLQKDFTEGVAQRLEGTDSPLTAEAVRKTITTAARRRKAARLRDAGEPPAGEPPAGEPPAGEPPAAPTTGPLAGLSVPQIFNIAENAEGRGPKAVNNEQQQAAVEFRDQLTAETAAPAGAAAPAPAAPEPVTITEEDIEERFAGWNPDAPTQGFVAMPPQIVLDLAEEYNISTEDIPRSPNGELFAEGKAEIAKRIIRKEAADTAEKVAQVATPPATTRPVPSSPELLVEEATAGPATFATTDREADVFLTRLDEALNTEEGAERLQIAINGHTGTTEIIDVSGEGTISLPMVHSAPTKDFSELTFRLTGERSKIVADRLGVDQMQVLLTETGRLALVNPLPDRKLPPIPYTETRPAASLEGIDVSEETHFDLTAFKAGEEIEEGEMAEVLEYVKLAARFGVPIRLSASARFGLPKSRGYSDKSDFLAKVVYDRYPIIEVEQPEGGDTFKSSRKKTFFDPKTGKKKVDGKLQGFLDKHGRGEFNNDPVVVAEMLAHNIPVKAPPEGTEGINPAFKIRDGWVVDVLRPTLDGQLKESMVTPIDKMGTVEANHDLADAQADVPFIEDFEKALPDGAHGLTPEGEDFAPVGMTVGDLELQLRQFLDRYTTDPRQFDSFMDFYGDEGNKLDDIIFREAAVGGATIEFRLLADLFEFRSVMLQDGKNLTAPVGAKLIVAPNKKRQVVKAFMSRMMTEDKKVVAERLRPLTSVTKSQKPTDTEVIVRFIEEKVLNNKDFAGGSMTPFTNIVRRNVDRYLAQQESKGVHEFNATFLSYHDQAAMDAAGLQNIENHAIYMGGQDTSDPLPPQVFSGIVKRNLDDAIGAIDGDETGDLRERLSDLAFQSIYSDPDPQMVEHVNNMDTKTLMGNVGGWMATYATNPDVAEFVALLESGSFQSGLDLRRSLRLNALANRVEGDPSKDEDIIEETRQLITESLGQEATRTQAVNFIKAMDQSIRRRLSRSHLTEAQRRQAAESNELEIAFLGLESGSPESVVEAIRKIAAESDNPNHRLVAEMLLEDEAFIQNIGFSMGESTLEIAGEYTKGKDGVHRVFINTANGNGRGLENVLLEEYIHAFLSDTINKTANQLTPKQRLARQRLEGLYAMALEQYADSGVENAILEDGLVNLDEFVASFLLSPEFQYHIKTLDTPEGQRGFFRRIIEAITGLFRKVTATEGKQFSDAMQDILDLGNTTHRNVNSKTMAAVAYDAAQETADANARRQEMRLRHARLTREPEQAAAVEETALEEAALEETTLEEAARAENAAEVNEEIAATEENIVVTTELQQAINYISERLPLKAHMTLSNDIDGYAMAVGNNVILNPEELATLFMGLDPISQKKLLYIIAHEELAHVASFAALTDADIDSIIEVLGDEDFDAIAVDYAQGQLNLEKRAEFLGGIRADLQSPDPVAVRKAQFKMVEEKLRMHLQKATRGFTTEEDMEFWTQNPSILSILKRYIRAAINRLVANRNLSREPHGPLDSAIYSMMNEMVAIESGFARTNVSLDLDPDTPAEVLETYRRAINVDSIEDIAEQAEQEAFANTLVFNLQAAGGNATWNALTRAAGYEMVRGNEFVTYVPRDETADGAAAVAEAATETAAAAATVAQTTGFRGRVNFAEAGVSARLYRSSEAGDLVGGRGRMPSNFTRAGYGLAPDLQTLRSIRLQDLRNAYGYDVLNPQEGGLSRVGAEGANISIHRHIDQDLYNKLMRQSRLGPLTLPPLSVLTRPTIPDAQMQADIDAGNIPPSELSRFFTVLAPDDHTLSVMEKRAITQTLTYLAFFSDNIGHGDSDIELTAPVPVMFGVATEAKNELLFTGEVIPLEIREMEDQLADSPRFYFDRLDSSGERSNWVSQDLDTLGDEVSLLSFGQGVPINNYSPTPSLSAAAPDEAALKEALLTLNTDTRHVEVDIGNGDFKVRVYNKRRITRQHAGATATKTEVDKTSWDAITGSIHGGGEIHIGTMDQKGSDVRQRAGGSGDAVPKAESISMALIAVLIRYNKKIGAKIITTGGSGSGVGEVNGTIREAAFKAGGMTQLIANAVAAKIAREGLTGYRSYRFSYNDPSENYTGEEVATKMAEDLYKLFWNRLNITVHDGAGLWSGFKTWPKFGFRQTEREVEVMHEKFKNFKEAPEGKSSFETIGGMGFDPERLRGGDSRSFISSFRRTAEDLGFSLADFGKGIITTTVQASNLAGPTWAFAKADQMFEAAKAAKDTVRADFASFVALLEQGAQEVGTPPPAGEAFAIDMFAAMHEDFAGETEKGRKQRKRNAKNWWGLFGDFTSYEFDLSEESASIKAIVRNPPFQRTMMSSDVKEAKFGLKDPKGNLVLDEKGEAVNKGYNREVKDARAAAKAENPNQTEEDFEPKRKEIADKYNSQLRDRGVERNVFTSAGASAPLTGHDFSNVIQLLEMPMFEDGAYKAPKGWFARMFKGDLGDPVKRLVEQRNEFKRASASVVGAFKKTLDGLVLKAFGTNPSVSEMELLAKAQGYIDGNLVSDAALKKIDDAHGVRRAAININATLTKAQKEAQIAASRQQRDDDITQLEDAAILKVKTDRDAALKTIEAKSPALFAHIVDMRKQLIEPLQQKLIASGIDADIALKIDKTGGIYLTRAYAMFTDPTYAARVKTDPAYQHVRDAAIRLFERQFFFHHLNMAKDSGKSDTEARKIAKAELNKANKSALATGVATTYGDQMLKHVLSRYDGTQSSDTFNSAGFKVIEDNLKSRKDLPKEFRALLGELGPEVGTDLIVRTTATVSSITAQQAFLHNLKELGTKNGWMITAKEFANDSAKYPDYVSIRKGTSSANDPLKHMYAPRELVEALEMSLGGSYLGKATTTAEQAVGTMANIAQKLTGKAMVAKTLGSVGFYLRNMLGNILFFGPAQGYGRLDKMLATSLTHTWQRLKDPDKLDAYLTEMIGLGIVGDEVRAGIMQELLSGKASPESVLAKLDEFTEDMAVVGKGKKTMRWIEKKAIALSAGVDGAFKLSYFEHELAVLIRAAKKHPTSKLGQMWNGGEGEYDLKREAARKVKMTAQSLSQAPPAVTALSRSQFGILFAPFLRFKAEVPRIVINTYKLGFQEMRSDNPLIRRRGAVRMGSMTGMTAIVSAAIPATLAALSGVGEEEDEALRKSMPSYLRGHTFWIRRNEDGELVSLDLTYLNPFSLLVDPVMRSVTEVQKGEFGKAGAAFATGLIFDTYLDDQILAGSVSDVLQNKNSTTDREIWIPEVDGSGSAMLKSLGYIFKEAYEPRILKDALQAREAVGGDYSEFSDSPLGEMLDGAYPVKVHKIDLEQQYRRFLRDHTKRVKLVTDKKYRLYSKKPIGDDEIKDIYDDEVDGRRALNAELRRVAGGFEGLGVSPQTQYQMMRDGGVGKRKAQLLFHGAMDRTAVNKGFAEGLYKRNLQHRLQPLMDQMNTYGRYLVIDDPE